MAKSLTLDDIKAKIEVIFEQKAANIIKIGAKGTLLYFTKDETLADGEIKTDTFKSALTIPTDFPQATKDMLKNIFKKGASEIVCVRSSGTFENAVSTIKKLFFNYIVSDQASDQSDVSLFAKENKVFAVTFNQKADSRWVINVTNPTVTLKDETTAIETVKYLPVIAGALAGLPYTRSATSIIFDELETVEMPGEITEGAFILNKEEDGIRVAAAVNSLVTLTKNVTADMKKIAVVEAMKRIDTDTIDAFKSSYKGLYKNHYDNQCLLIAALRAYYRELEKMELLDPNYDNTVDVDVETQREAWLERGKAEAEQWDEQTVKYNTIADMVYLLSDVKILDAIEGLKSRVALF